MNFPFHRLDTFRGWIHETVTKVTETTGLLEDLAELVAIFVRGQWHDELKNHLFGSPITKMQEKVRKTLLFNKKNHGASPNVKLALLEAWPHLRVLEIRTPLGTTSKRSFGETLTLVTPFLLSAKDATQTYDTLYGLICALLPDLRCARV